MKPNWQISPPNPKTVAMIQRAVPCHWVTATILANRGFHSLDRINAFLQPSLSNLRSPLAIKDMDAAVNRIDIALKRNEKILIFGDYDADGVTATTLLYHFLGKIGAEVTTFIPHRVADGYGLSEPFITDQASNMGIDLIITVDNGSTSHEAVESARAENIDVIIIDHHTITPPYPAAVAVINPKRPDCSAGLEDLAGVGVAFAVLVAMRKHLREAGYWRNHPEPNLKEVCDLVALGTVADMVPLRDDNRILTHAGLEVIRRQRARPGISALLAQAGVSEDTINSEDIAYRLAPRLNAAGRMDHAEAAFSLLATKHPGQAAQMAEQLERLNIKRQKVQKRLLDRIHAAIEEEPELVQKTALVLWGENWHEGVLGVVAARLLNKYHRPVVLISTRNGIGKGSARSIPGFDLYEGLTACREILLSFGGHAAAAGLKVAQSRLKSFRDRFEKIATQAVDRTMMVPTFSIDCEMNLNGFSDELLDELESLAPYGKANPQPLFISRDIEVASWRVVGETHLSMQLKQPGEVPQRNFGAIQFNVDPQIKPPQFFEAVVYRIGWNRWNQTKQAQMIVESTSG